MKKQLYSIVGAGLLTLATSAQASFIANFHENLNSGNNVLYVFGAEGTDGTITGNDGFSESFTIGASGVYERNFGARGREMTFNGVLNNNSLLVESADSISGIALNRGSATTDQTNLLDLDGLGSEYVVLTAPGRFGSGSQVSVTAVEDNTEVTITSPIALNGNAANSPFTVTLDAGESIFYESGANADISGTEISATADVAVFSGAECTQVPIGVHACDHLINQQFSTDNFDTSFKIVENPGGGADSDLVRVMAGEDNTEVFYNGVSQGTIDRGEFIEIDRVGNADITSDKPVTVGQFIRGQSGTRTIGDPAFAIIPGENQWLDDYVFTTPVGSDSFAQNWLNIAINIADVSSLMLNGAALSTAGFTTIGSYLFGSVAIGTGVGNVTADGNFLATTSGFSSFDSFFNPIATSFSTGASPSVPAPASIAVFLVGLLALARRKK